MKTIELKVYSNRDKQWYQNGEFHREDGPAIEYASGRKKWYQNGKFIKREPRKQLNLKFVQMTPKNGTKMGKSVKSS